MPATVRNITFQKTLPIDDRSVRKLECKKCNSEDGETENFEILQKTEHGEILLSTANLNSKRKGCKESPTCLADAGKCLYKHVPKNCNLQKRHQSRIY